MTDRRVLVFTATYNEAGNIREFCRQVLDLDVVSRLLVVDDASPDGTGQILDDIATKEPRLQVIHRKGKLGLASAHKLAMLQAVDDGFDLLITMDADLSHDPNDIPRLIGAAQGAPFVTGSRYMPGGGCNYTGYRLVLSRGANLLGRLLLGVPLHEFTTSYRAFDVRTLAGFDLSRFDREGYSFFMDTVVRLHRAGWRCAEVPIVFHDRASGSSKLPRNAIVDGMRNMLRLVLERLLPNSGRARPRSAPCGVCGSDKTLKSVCLVCGGTSRV